MKQILALFFLIAGITAYSHFALAQAPSGASGWAGLITIVLLIVNCFNVVMSGAAQIFNYLKMQEPSWMQQAGSIGAWLVQVLSANTPTPAAQVQAQLNSLKKS